MKKKKTKKIVVAVSGGFDPVHIGHVRMFEEAKALGDELVVILNNDNWLEQKKGFVFMPQEQRKEILGAIRHVDRVIFTKHGPRPKDMSVCQELKDLKPDIFVNGGDRIRSNVPEVGICQKMDCKMVFNVGLGGKVQSSSRLVKNFLKNKNIHYES